MSKQICWIFAVAALAASSSAFAQARDWGRDTRQVDPTNKNNSQMDPAKDTPASTRVYTQMLDYGTCVSGMGKNLVTKVLDAQPHSSGERQGFNDLRTRMSSCRSSQNSNILSLQRGSIAEGLYHKTENRLPVGWQMSQQGYDKFAAEETSFNSLRKDNDQQMIKATNCLAALAPIQAGHVLATKHGSDEESAAMDDLFRIAPSCAGPTRPANLSRSFLRAFLADSLYRVTVWANKRADGAAAGN